MLVVDKVIHDSCTGRLVPTGLHRRFMDLKTLEESVTVIVKDTDTGELFGYEGDYRYSTWKQLENIEPYGYRLKRNMNSYDLELDLVSIRQEDIDFLGVVDSVEYERDLSITAECMPVAVEICKAPWFFHMRPVYFALDDYYTLFSDMRDLPVTLLAACRSNSAYVDGDTICILASVRMTQRKSKVRKPESVCVYRVRFTDASLASKFVKIAH